MTTEAAIHIQSVVKSYRSQKVLDEATLIVPPGKVVAVLGKNGAGKTTTIRMLMGFIKPDAGTNGTVGK